MHVSLQVLGEDQTPEEVRTSATPDALAGVWGVCGGCVTSTSIPSYTSVARAPPPTRFRALSFPCSRGHCVAQLYRATVGPLVDSLREESRFRSHCVLNLGSQHTGAVPCHKHCRASRTLPPPTHSEWHNNHPTRPDGLFTSSVVAVFVCVCVACMCVHGRADKGRALFGEAGARRGGDVGPDCVLGRAVFDVWAARSPGDVVEVGFQELGAKVRGLLDGTWVAVHSGAGHEERGCCALLTPASSALASPSPTPFPVPIATSPPLPFGAPEL